MRRLQTERSFHDVHEVVNLAARIEMYNTASMEPHPAIIDHNVHERNTIRIVRANGTQKYPIIIDAHVPYNARETARVKSQKLCTVIRRIQ